MLEVLFSIILSFQALCFIESDLLQAVNVPEPLVKNLLIL